MDLPLVICFDCGHTVEKEHARKYAYDPNIWACNTCATWWTD